MIYYKIYIYNKLVQIFVQTPLLQLKMVETEIKLSYQKEKLLPGLLTLFVLHKEAIKLFHMLSITLDKTSQNKRNAIFIYKIC